MGAAKRFLFRFTSFLDWERYHAITFLCFTGN
jgi:hypothetical protein